MANREGAGGRLSRPEVLDLLGEGRDPVSYTHLDVYKRQVLERTNNQLVENIPPKMFVTCLYALLEPATGHLVFANAGHDVPFRRTAEGVVELRARGMPLGLLPGMQYEQHEATLRPGECMLLYSDGLVEAHSPTREMFGFPRLQALMAEPNEGQLVPFLLDRLSDFTGPDWEQEDDVTMVLLLSLIHIYTGVLHRRAGHFAHRPVDAGDHRRSRQWRDDHRHVGVGRLHRPLRYLP